MPPVRSRAVQEYSRETPNSRDKYGANAGTASKSRKSAGNTTAPTQMSKEDMARLYPVTARSSVNGSEPGISWPDEDVTTLQSYRNAYNLDVNPAFRSAYSAAVLAGPGIGRNSPTMAVKKNKRKMPKEQLALAVRKHFNGMAVNETDVILEMLYKVRNQDQSFRVRFGPNKQKQS